MRKTILTRLADVWRRFRVELIGVLLSWAALAVLWTAWPPPREPLREPLLSTQGVLWLLTAAAIWLFGWLAGTKRFKGTVTWLSRHAPWWPEVGFVFLLGTLMASKFFLGGEFVVFRPSLAIGASLGLGSFVFWFLRTFPPSVRGAGYVATVALATGMALSSSELAPSLLLLGALGWMGVGMNLGFELGKRAEPGETPIEVVARVVRQGRGRYRFGVPDEEWFKTCYEARKLLAEGLTWEEVTSRLEVREKTLRRWLEVYDAIRRDLATGDPPETVAQRYNRSLPVLTRYLRRLSER
jgi:hypothetical protein